MYSERVFRARDFAFVCSQPNSDSDIRHACSFDSELTKGSRVSAAPSYPASLWRETRIHMQVTVALNSDSESQRYKVSSFHSVQRKSSPPAPLSRPTEEFSPVRLNRFCGAYLRDGGPRRHIGSPTGLTNPAHSIHPASSAYYLSSSSVDIQGVRRFSKMWMTPMAGSFEGPMIRHIASPNKSLEQPIRGDLHFVLIIYRY
jgi:hypothetical protein